MIPSFGKYVEHQELSDIANSNAKCYRDFGKTVWEFITKVNIQAPYDHS